MNDSSYQDEGEDDGGPTLVPFPSHTRTGWCPRPNFVHPPTNYPSPPTSSLDSHTLPPSHPLSHKVSAASVASASSSNYNKLLRQQPSLQALHTPTPTTPNIVERTWTRKISIWPPPVTADDDPFAATPPSRKVAHVIPTGFQLHVTMAGSDSMARHEDVDEEEMALKTPVAANHAVIHAQNASPVEDVPDSPTSIYSTVTVIHGDHNLQDGWTEISAPSTPSFDRIIIPSTPTTSSPVAEPTTPKSIKKRAGSIRDRWRSIARRALASAETERPSKQRKGSTASEVNNNSIRTRPGTEIAGAQVVQAGERNSVATLEVIADDHSEASTGKAAPVTVAIPSTSVGDADTLAPTETTQATVTSTALSTVSSQTTTVPTSPAPPIPTRSPARPRTTARLTIPASSLSCNEPSPTPTSARPATPTSVRSSKSKRSPKLFIDTGAGSATGSKSQGFGTPETAGTAGHGGTQVFMSTHGHGNARRGSEDLALSRGDASQAVAGPTPLHSAVHLVSASGPVDAQAGSRMTATPMSSPSVYSSSPHSIHFPNTVAGSGTDPAPAPVARSSDIDVFTEGATEPELESRTRQPSITAVSNYTSHSRFSASTSSSRSRIRSFSLGSSVSTESTAATSLGTQGQSQGVPSPASSARRRGSLKPEEHETNEADCVPPVPKLPTGLLLFAGEHGHEQRPSVDRNGTGKCETQFAVKGELEANGENVPTARPLSAVQHPWPSTIGCPTSAGPAGAAMAVPRPRPRSRTELNMYPPDSEWRFSRNSSFAAFDAFLKDPCRSSLDLGLTFPTSSAASISQSMQQSFSSDPRALGHPEHRPHGVDAHDGAEEPGQDANARVRARIISLAASQMSPYAIALPSSASLALRSPASAYNMRDSPPLSNDAKFGSKLVNPVKGMEKKANELREQRSIAKLEQEAFRESGELSTADVYRAAQLDVLNVNGEKVRFGSLFEDTLAIVCFIRHFWCPHCQDYMRSIVDSAPKESLDRAGVKLVIIGCGSPTMAKAYKENVFHSPYEIYVDPTRALYRALGMTRRTTKGGAEKGKGEYVVHGSVGGIGMVLKNALKMPFGYPGDMKQLGGEFLLGPGIRSDYCHRMPTTKGHTSIRQLLRLADVDLGDSTGSRTKRPVSEASASLGARSTQTQSLYSTTTQLPPHIDDNVIRQRKDTWDELIRWSQERWMSSNLLASTETLAQEPYPYAFADQHVRTEHGGAPCGNSDMTTPYCCSSPERAHQDFTPWGVRVF